MVDGGSHLGRAATLKSLKLFAENGLWDTPNFGKVLSEESDRGAVIILVSIIDDVLAAALERKMVPLNSDEKARLFGFDAPLGSFSARIKMAYALGVIDKDDRDDLNVMRAMRNACAHSRGGLSFDDEVLRHAMALLVTPGEMRVHIINDEMPFMRKINFMAIIRFLMAKIGGSSSEEAEGYADELYAMLLREMQAMVKASGGGSP